MNQSLEVWQTVLLAVAGGGAFITAVGGIWAAVSSHRTARASVQLADTTRRTLQPSIVMTAHETGGARVIRVENEGPGIALRTEVEFTLSAGDAHVVEPVSASYRIGRLEAAEVVSFEFRAPAASLYTTREEGAIIERTAIISFAITSGPDRDIWSPGAIRLPNAEMPVTFKTVVSAAGYSILGSKHCPEVLNWTDPVAPARDLSGGD